MQGPLTYQGLAVQKMELMYRETGDVLDYHTINPQKLTATVEQTAVLDIVLFVNYQKQQPVMKYVELVEIRIFSVISKI